MSNRLLVVLIFLLTFCLFFAKGILFLDPDLGWYIKTGEYILERGIPVTDPYSYTMPSYQWVNSDWFSNLVIAKLYPQIGIIGLSLIYSLLAAGALFFITPFKSSKLMLGVIFLAVTELFLYAGIRAQVASWLFFSILIYLISNPIKWKKWRFFTSIMMVLWVNLHGGFVLGVGLISLKLITDFFEKRRLSKGDLSVLGLNIFASFINPYIFGIWHEVWMHVTDGDLRWYIAEWQPMLFRTDLAFWVLVVISVALLVRFQKNITLFEKILFFGLLLASISSARHVPLWIIISIPLVEKSLRQFYQQIKNNRYSIKIARRFWLIFTISSFLLSLLMFYLLLPDILYSGESSYPKQAVEFLKTNPPKGQIFSLYGWGGYLIWKLPEKKSFIDGRMTTWRDHYVLGESSYALKDYKGITEKGESFNVLAQKYNISTVIWPREKHLLKKPINIPWLEELLNEKNPNFGEQLLNSGWKVNYQDKVAVIYQYP